MIQSVHSGFNIAPQARLPPSPLAPHSERSPWMCIARGQYQTSAVSLPALASSSSSSIGSLFKVVRHRFTPNRLQTPVTNDIIGSLGLQHHPASPPPALASSSSSPEITLDVYNMRLISNIGDKFTSPSPLAPHPQLVPCSELFDIDSHTPVINPT